MKKALASTSTDWHIKDDNTEQIIDLVRQQCELNKKLGINYIICFGDIFNSRKSQSLLTLNAFGRILDMILEYEMYLWAIPGNHDKTSYESDDSFLDQFRYHPCFNLINIEGSLPFKDDKVFLHFLPFLSNDLWIERYETMMEHLDVSSLNNDEKHILCSHIAVNGSQNNDGSKVISSIKPSMFKGFHKVFLGHYHNQQQIGKNVYHLPSIQQNNFGEDEDKGFTILYDDGSHELIRSEFRPFRKLKLDVDRLSKEEVKDYIKKYEKEAQNAHIRFILEGSEERLKSVSKEQFLQAGIDVKTKSSEIGIVEDFDTVEISQYTEESIVDEFSEFCEEKDLDFEEGVKFLR